MLSLVFLLVIASVFGAILLSEAERLPRGPMGLLGWISHGNWPAKVGGALLVFGVGALLRYAALHFEAPPELKLGVGMVGTLVLGVAAPIAGARRHRAVSLALGGAAFGVAYLTAYSAFALFGYLPTLPGLGLLALTAVGAGVYAVTRGALSLAVLSMVGAFMAPAFAPEDPGPQVVYGYYVAVSLLTLCMVTLRGWRPLVHLSFLFTLAGGAFFAWTSGYFAREHAAQMLPLIVMLVAVHVAMPLAENRGGDRGALVARLDTAYLCLLPLVAVLAAWVVAPGRRALAAELWWFAGTWLTAAAWLFSRRRAGMVSHVVISVLMAGCGVAVLFRDLPWELIALGAAVGALVLAAHGRHESRAGWLAALVLLFGALHVVNALAPLEGATLFLNGRFFERLVGAGLLMIAAVCLRRLRHGLEGLMLTVALAWAVFAAGAEVARLDVVSPWLLLHWMFVLAAFGVFLLGARWPGLDGFASPLVCALVASIVFAQYDTAAALARVSAALAGVALVALALRPVARENDGRTSRMLAAFGAPIAVALWIVCAERGVAHLDWQTPMACAAAIALLMLAGFAFARERARDWSEGVVGRYAAGFTVLLAIATLFDIERQAGAVVLELMCLAGLFAVRRQRGKPHDWALPVLVIGSALVLQANLLRWLGPAGHLDALSVTRMNWPTVISLLWACIGAALTIAARRAGSRVQWSAGAAFLVGAAIKLVLLDFGSLGELANILAVIAAAGVFLLVGWLSPMPPARDPAPAAPTTRGAPEGDAPRTPATKVPETPPPAGGALEMPEAYWRPRPPSL